jgi:hypothetical protein
MSIEKEDIEGESFDYVVSEEVAIKEVDKFLQFRRIYKGSSLYKRFKDPIKDLVYMVMEGFVSFDFENQKIVYISESHNGNITIPFRITTKDKNKINGIPRENAIDLTNACVQIVSGLPIGIVANMDSFDIERLITIYTFL